MRDTTLILDAPAALLGTQPVFKVATRTYRWKDVLVAAALRGDLAALESRALESWRALRRVPDAQWSQLLERADECGRRFRYERGLLSGEETEGWLERWNLTVEDWHDYLTRCAGCTAGAACAAGLGGVDAEGGSMADVEPEGCELARLIHCEAVCSGALDSFSRSLAQAAAAAAECRARGRPPSDGGVAASCYYTEDLRLAELMLGVDAVRLRAAAASLAALRGAVEHLCTLACDPNSLARECSTHALAWLRLDADRLEVSGEQVAQEAIERVRCDGAPLDHVVVESQARVSRWRGYADDSDPAVARCLVSARPGEVVGPVRDRGRVALFVLRGKTPPTLQDPQIQRRARELLRRRAIDQAVRAWVVWL